MKQYAWIAAAFALPMLVYGANQEDLQKLLELKEKPATHLDLSNADLRDYHFAPGKIDLQNANLSHSNLAGVDLSKMNLSGADLSYANVSHAKLNQTNLTGANLDHAILTGASLINTITNGVIGYSYIDKTPVNCEG